MPAVNPFFTFLSLVIQQTTRISTTFQKTDYSDALLGSVGVPSLALITEYCVIHLRMWFWFTATLLHFYQPLIDAAKPDFGSRYLCVANVAQKLQITLDQNYDRLLSEEQARYAKPRDK
jgi:hypothetical protein